MWNKKNKIRKKQIFITIYDAFNRYFFDDNRSRNWQKNTTKISR